MSENESLVEEAYEILKRNILDQELNQGSPVVEADIAEELNMSRTPIREAIRRLHADGLVEVIPRKGSYVKTFTVDDLIFLYEVAEGLEGMVGFLVAEKIMNKDLDNKVLSYCDEMVRVMDESALANDYKAWIDADANFHRHLYKLCGNKTILQSLERIRIQLNMSIIQTVPTFIDFKQSNLEHRKLLKFVYSGEPNNARIVNQEQHQRVRNYIKAHSLRPGR